MNRSIRWLREISLNDVALVGGKGASLGEMYQALQPLGVPVPNGFAITADAYTMHIQENHLEEKIKKSLETLSPANVGDLSRVGREIRALISEAPLPVRLSEEILKAHEELLRHDPEASVAVRSSATAEDLPQASFAGQQESFLNVRGRAELLRACRDCFASLYTDRAISYRIHQGFAHEQVRLSICVQKMVRSDEAASGVIFTLDTESGNQDMVIITSSYGLGENLVLGRVDPDEFLVSKSSLKRGFRPILRRRVGAKQLRLIYSSHGSQRTRNVEVSDVDRERLSLTDAEVLTLANWALLIEAHYSQLRGRATPMDIEWAKDGPTGELWIVQARPETVHSRKAQVPRYQLSRLKSRSQILVEGIAVGSSIGAGRVRVIRNVSEMDRFRSGEVLVADMTDPDWEPLMKKASALVTNRGGRTCHAAIVSRELGIPCVVGTGRATQILATGRPVTVSCAEGECGQVWDGILPFETLESDLSGARRPKTLLEVNLGNPAAALKTALLPVDGVGLARLEFIIAEHIGIHPLALTRFDEIKDEATRARIEKLTRGYENHRSRYYVDRLIEGVGLIAGAFYPRPVTVRFSDFKSNEYSKLLGGAQFEPREENPMLGFRGASRYVSPLFAEAFALECQALHFVRDQMGLTNVRILIPFCRTPAEGENVLREMSRHGLERGRNGLEVWVMCELPANVICADRFLEIFDGFSIGSNDLTQSTLGVDRDSELLQFDEREESVKRLIRLAIHSAKERSKPVAICGQAPSDYPEYLPFLVEEGIDAISVSPDVVLRSLLDLGKVEIEHAGTRFRRPVAPAAPGLGG